MLFPLIYIALPEIILPLRGKNTSPQIITLRRDVTGG